MTSIGWPLNPVSWVLLFWVGTQKIFDDFHSKVLSNFHPKLEFKAFLRTKGTVEASGTREPQYCHCCLLKSRCGPISQWQKRTLAKELVGQNHFGQAAVCTKCLDFFSLQTVDFTIVTIVSISNLNLEKSLQKESYGSKIKVAEHKLHSGYLVRNPLQAELYP